MIFPYGRSALEPITAVSPTGRGLAHFSARFAWYTANGRRPKDVPVPLRRQGQSHFRGENGHLEKQDPLRRENWDSPL